MVARAIRQARPGTEIEFKFKASLGDLNPDRSLTDFQKGAFTSDFVKDLVTGEYDMVVHSWKDLPTEKNESTVVAATLPRADVRDLLLVPKTVVSQKPAVMRVLASSPRRAYNLSEFLPKIIPWTATVEFTPVRGNIQTRINKLLAGEGEALIVAKAAIDRLLATEGEEFAKTRAEIRAGIDTCNWMVLPLSQNPSAAAQGALAIEISEKRTDLKHILGLISDPVSFAEAEEERLILSQYGGGCHQKIGVSVLSRDQGSLISLRGLTLDGRVLRRYEWRGQRPIEKAKSESAIFPSTPSAAKWFERKALDESAWRTKIEAARALWVARVSAWPEGFNGFGRWVWTAGIASWVELAKAGVWVHGCSDHMGESEPPMIDSLAGSKLEWRRLTHAAAADNESIATYELVPSAEPPDLKGKTHFYWMSGSSFERALKLFPEEIQSGVHACGGGKTKKLINERLGREPHVFLTWSQWRESVLSRGDENENR
jgi:hydroxymethylbilane synthase